MTDKELKKMKRTELLEVLVDLSEENTSLRKQIERLEQQNAALQEKLQDREIHLQKAGSIAEASLQLNGVFEAAQKAADQYLENIRGLNQQAERKAAPFQKKEGRRLEIHAENNTNKPAASQSTADNHTTEAGTSAGTTQKPVS
ncbi:MULTISPECIES: hypothetical protein [Caproicibacterium]|jgi:TusA-related sulfurtransferase|uniref:hypothetical protein n=1 Tax=Caproicibacterium TaxID=2834348 RepID=UPI0015749050|nr:hypothetical protein [Caproicibacterium lactatifermentans]MDD4807603.1 hypothetical protein [Oscillospiraceae bacterium]